MLELLVGCGGGNKKTLLVTGSQTANDAGSGDCGVADGNDILEFSFEDTVYGALVLLRAIGALAQCALVRVALRTCRSSQKRLLRQSHRRW